MGSTVAARRAGTKEARSAAAISNSVTPPRMSGSRELSFTHFVANLPKIDAEQNAGDEPRAYIHRRWMTAPMRKMSAALAPSAMRMPNSLVRVVTP